LQHRRAFVLLIGLADNVERVADKCSARLRNLDAGRSRRQELSLWNSYFTAFVFTSLSYERAIHIPANGCNTGGRRRRAKMVGQIGSHGWRERKLRDWLLLLLRFAITRDPLDRSAVMALADELDSLGELGWRPTAPSFFRRTSAQVIEAILAGGGKGKRATLETHISRIEDPRLRRAFRAAVGLTPEPPQPETQSRRRKASGLWTGLLQRK
jgi:hypothetical protein